MAKASLQETVLREHCKSSPSAAQALDELLLQLATLRLVTKERDDLRALAETIVEDETDRDALKAMARALLGYA